MSEKTIGIAEAMKDPDAAVRELGGVSGVGGAYPASVPAPAEDAPRAETGPEERLTTERTEEDAAVETDAGQEEAAPEPAGGEQAGEVPPEPEGVPAGSVPEGGP